MSNYTQSTNFATKDALSSGNPLKIVKGTEINTEFANIAIAVATKADLVSPTFTGTPLAPTAATATNTTQLATTAFVQAVAQLLHPVGSIYTATVATNPNTLFGFGTWTAFGAGRMLISLDSTNALFNTAEETGGSADSIVVSHTHTATVTDPGHAHSLPLYDPVSGGAGGSGLAGIGSAFATGANTTSITVANSTTGVSGTNANYPPFIAVYMWKRTA
jgi:hypothetical protein